jgi:hypothetical protein
MTDSELKAYLEEAEKNPRQIAAAVSGLPDKVLRYKPAPDKWSIHEHACHLAEVHPLMLQRLTVMLSDQDPVIRSYDPGRDDPDDRLLRLDLDDTIERYARDRTALVERLRRLTEAEWRRTAQHDEYNEYSVFTMFRHLALHDFLHAYRIEELLLKREWPPPHRTGK